LFNSALGSLLNRIEQTEDRDLLQAHYTDIHHEIIAKTELLKQQRQKIRSLEREIVDIQGEFQLDRADYLDTVRRLEKRNKFYEQFFEKISPILKRDGRVWNIDYIKSESTWVDDLKKWKIPESLIMHVKLPPATSHSPRAPSSTESVKSRDNNTSLTAPARLECLADSFESDESDEKQKDIDLALTYFRPKRVEKLIHQNRTWKDLSQQNLTTSNNPYEDANNIMNKTWYAGGHFFKKAQHPWNLNLNSM
jgi:kinesin family protein 3/17